MWNWVQAITDLSNRGQTFVIATVALSSGSAPREVGAKMIICENGECIGTIGGGVLESLVISDAKELMTAGKSEKRRYPLGAKTGQCCGGVVEILFEVMGLAPRLFVFGAGHVGQAVSQTMVGTAFQTHLIDPRPEWIHSSEIPKAVLTHDLEWRDFVKKVEWESASSARQIYVVIMTHLHSLDREILSFFLKKDLAYLGLIGSRSKWVSFKRDLISEGATASELDRVHCPIGIEKIGKSPKEIAISFAAQILSIHFRNESTQKISAVSEVQARS